MSGRCILPFMHYLSHQQPFGFPPQETALRKPSRSRQDQGTLDVYVHGMDDQLWSTDKWNGQAWSSSYTVTPGELKWDPKCPDCCSPASSNRTRWLWDVYVRGEDDRMLVTTYSDASWSAYKSLGGIRVSSPGTFPKRRQNRADMAVVMAEERTAGDFGNGVWWKQLLP